MPVLTRVLQWEFSHTFFSMKWVLLCASYMLRALQDYPQFILIQTDKADRTRVGSLR